MARIVLLLNAIAVGASERSEEAPRASPPGEADICRRYELFCRNARFHGEIPAEHCGKIMKIGKNRGKIQIFAEFSKKIRFFGQNA
jgi:hypothetical protein